MRQKVTKSRFAALEPLWKIASISNVKRVLFDCQYIWIIGLIVLFGELVLNIAIVETVSYTEIDWKAYMQEVEGFFVNGTRDYTELRGDTGPLVYPAGFVYVFGALRYFSGNGLDIRRAQYLFVSLYLVNLALIIRIYEKTRIIPPWVLLFVCCTSYRIHSIFVLRLFNDPVAVTVFHVALNLFINGNYILASLLYSFSVSIKMNMLLYAPALFLIFVASRGLIRTTLVYLPLCALVQLVLAWPFLAVNPVGYLQRSFDLGRVFLHKWTVNYRFLPNEYFVNRWFHVALLAGHIATLLVFAFRRWLPAFGGLSAWQQLYKQSDKRVPAQAVCVLLFISNFVGVVFARSLHYQFYVWYYYSLPVLLWSVRLPTKLRLLLWGLLEFSWNTYPSTVSSSLLLHGCHVFLLICLYRSKYGAA